MCFILVNPVCTIWATQNCLSCDISGCFTWNRGYAPIATVGGIVSSWTQWTTNSIFAKDCVSWGLTVTSGVVSSKLC